MIKLAIAAAVLERGLDGDLEVSDLDRARGDGLLREWTLPLRLPIRDLVTAMTVLSDNTATNTLLAHLGVDRVNRSLDGWGYQVTRSLGPVPGSSGDERGIGTTTALETVRLLDELLDGRFGGRLSGKWFRGVLERQQDDRALSRYLAPGTHFAHKSGTWRTYRHDGGVLFGADGTRLTTIAVFTEGLGPDIERHDHPAVLAMGRLMADLVRALELPVALVPWSPV
jgi:beta-lactamase class A